MKFGVMTHVGSSMFL